MAVPVHILYFRSLWQYQFIFYILGHCGSTSSYSIFWVTVAVPVHILYFRSLWQYQFIFYISGHCGSTQFICGPKGTQCFHEKVRCNGLNDCSDNIDEIGCSKSK